MIRGIRFLNYRSCGDTRLELRPLTLLVGPAGSGKSNLLKGLVFLQNTIHRTAPDELFAGLGLFHLVRSRWAEETASIGIEVELSEIDDYPGVSATYSVKFADSPDGIYILEETLQKSEGVSRPEWAFQRYASSGKKPTVGREFGSIQPRGSTILGKCFYSKDVDRNAATVKFARSVALALSSVGYYHLEVSELKATSSGGRERIGYNGEGLPDFIAATQKDRPESSNKILAAMAELLPGLEGILVTHLDQARIGIAFGFEGHRGHIAAPELSDGTILTLGLLSILSSTKRPRLLAIEEPETGLHPRRLRWLFDRFVAVAYPKDGERPTQVLLTTHSPFLVNLFEDLPESISIVELREGKTLATPFSVVQQKLHDPAASISIGFRWATGLFEGL